jgi:exportin-1
MDPNILLNPSLPFDQTKVQIFDQLARAFYSPDPTQRAEADTILKNFKALPDAWLHTDAIIEYSLNPDAKFLALYILEEAINVSLV